MIRIIVFGIFSLASTEAWICSPKYRDYFYTCPHVLVINSATAVEQSKSIAKTQAALGEAQCTNKANKAHVLAQLQVSTTPLEKTASNEWEYLAVNLCKSRDRLNNYVNGLHESYHNWLTFYRALDFVIKNRSLPNIRLDWSSPQQHDRQDYENLFNLINQLEYLIPKQKTY